MLLGSYSADVDLQGESARLVFGGDLPLEKLISHRVPLESNPARHRYGAPSQREISEGRCSSAGV